MKAAPSSVRCRRQRPRRLGGVHQQRHTRLRRNSGDLLQRLDAAEHVGHMVDDHRIRPSQNGPSELLRRLLPPEGRRIHRQAHLRYGIQGAAGGVVLIAGDHHPAAGNHQRPDGDVQPVGAFMVNTTFSGDGTPNSAALGPAPEGRLSARRAAGWPRPGVNSSAAACAMACRTWGGFFPAWWPRRPDRSCPRLPASRYPSVHIARGVSPAVCATSGPPAATDPHLHRIAASTAGSPAGPEQKLRMPHCSNARTIRWAWVTERAMKKNPFILHSSSRDILCESAPCRCGIRHTKKEDSSSSSFLSLTDQFSARWISATAWADIPSPSPVKPRCSSVVALTFTCSGRIPSVRASAQHLLPVGGDL